MTDEELIRRMARLMGWQIKENRIVDAKTGYLGGKLGEDFDPIHNYNHTMMVVEAMKSKGWWGRIDIMPFSFEVEFYHPKDPRAVFCDFEIGRAVCEAAWKAEGGGAK